MSPKKYRGKRKDNGEWVYGDKVSVRKRCYIICGIPATSDDMVLTFIGQGCIFEVIPETVGQSTGLNDWWEGDIGEIECISLVGKIIQGEDGKWLIYKDEDNYVGLHHNIDKVIKIGNVHENPELIGGPK